MRLKKKKGRFHKLIKDLHCHKLYLKMTFLFTKQYPNSRQTYQITPWPSTTSWPSSVDVLCYMAASINYFSEINQRISFLINRFVYKMSKHFLKKLDHNFPQLQKETSSNCFFCSTNSPEPKDFIYWHMTVDDNDTESLQIFSSKKLESANVLILLLEKND